MKEFFKVIAALLLFILAILGLLVFARNFNKQPSVLLRSTQCNPPCWYGITPGRSTTSQVYAVLDHFKDVNQDTILGEYNRNQELVKIFWFFQRPAEDQMGSVNIKNDRVTAINISTVNSLTLSDLFARAGEPEEYLTAIGQRDDGEEFLDVVFLSPTKGYAAEVVIDIGTGSDQVEIKAGTPVFRVTYFSSGMYEELLGTRILIDKPAGRRDPFRTWSGYGPIQIKKE